MNNRFEGSIQLDSHKSFFYFNKQPRLTSPVEIEGRY